MSAMFDFLDQLARLTLEALLNSIWQGMLITALVWMLLRTMKRASATTRHAIWMISLLTISALPFTVIITKFNDPADQAVIHREGPGTAKPALLIPAPPNMPKAERLTVEESVAIPADRDPLTVGPIISLKSSEQAFSDGQAFSLNPPPAIRPPIAGTTIHIPEEQNLWQQMSTTFLKGPGPMALVCLWLILFTIMVVRIACSYAFILRLQCRLGFVPSRQRQRMQRLAEVFGIKRTIHLFTSHRITMPLTVGSMKPMIILPPDLAHSLSDGEFDSIVAHELAHIKRWDYLTNLLQRIIQALLFFHPAVWFIGKQLILERELACDDWAVKTCEPRRYASCLTRLVELLNESKPRTAVRLAATGILFGKHVITRRVEMILNRDRNVTTVVSKPALLYAIGLALSFIIVCSLLSPVIAVPLTQKPGKPQSKKTAKPGAPAQPKPQEGMLLPLLSEPPEFPEAPEVPEPPDFPMPPVIAGGELDDDLFALPAPPAPAATPAFPDAPSAPIAPQAPVAATPATPAPRPMPAPGSEPFASTFVFGQDDKNKTPVIPESELLNVLVDIVKKDSDPTVRNEALSGIYRMRSDAAINALIGLYDSMSDAKVKSEIIGYLIRRNGDNSKAIAKLVSIVKNEKNEDLRNRAIRYLGAVRGDDGAENLIQIYDSLQDQKSKLYVIRSLGYNKSRKAVDKLIQIAKNDSDPAVRQSAVRALYGIDNRIYLDLIDGKPARVGTLYNGLDFDTPGDFRYFVTPLGAVQVTPLGAVQFDTKKWEEAQKEWQEKSRELLQNLEKLKLDNFKFDFDQRRLDEILEKLEIELPKIELRLKEMEDGKIIDLRRREIGSVEGLLAQYQSLLANQLAKQRTSLGNTNPKVLETQKVIKALEKQLATVRRLQTRQPLPARVTLAAPRASAIR